MEQSHKKIIFEINNKDKGKRIDRFLFDRGLEISRSRIQKLINIGKVKSSGTVISKNYILKGNEIIEVEDINLPVLDYYFKPQDIKLNIIYEDEYFMAVSKDAGMVVYPAPGHYENTLVNALINYNEKFSGVGGNLRAGIVHRLDKDTSGIILVAKDNRTHTILSEKFRQRQIKKTYEALVYGNFKEAAGTIDMPIGRSFKDRKKMSVVSGGRKSLTDFKVTDRFKCCSLIEVYPETGRTHQIRVHLAFIGHPIIGDKTYGNKETEKIAKEIGLYRQFLHAKRIVLTHPITGKEIDLINDLPDDLSDSIDILNLKYRY